MAPHRLAYLGIARTLQGVGLFQRLTVLENVMTGATRHARAGFWPALLGHPRGGADGISAINTILSVIGVNLETLRPMPTVEGYTVPGGYSAQAVKPIALRMVSQLGLGLPKEVSISGIGGIERSHDAIEFMLLGASTVQICTGVMLQGVKMVDELKEGVEKFLVDKKFDSVQEIVGKSLEYFSTHMDLVQRMKAAKRSKAGEASRDNEWAQKDITEKTAELTSN